MTDEQIYQLIVKLYEGRDRKQAGDAWDRVADKLKEKGVISSRTGRALKGQGCRSIYYNFSKRPSLAKPELRTHLIAMKRIMTLNTNPEIKMKLIQQMLDELDLV